MFNLESSQLEQKLYARVTEIINEHVNKSKDSDAVYNEAQKALALVYEEIIAQRFAALHFKQEALRSKTNVEN